MPCLSFFLHLHLHHLVPCSITSLVIFRKELCQRWCVWASKLSFLHTRLFLQRWALLLLSSMRAEGGDGWSELWFWLWWRSSAIRQELPGFILHTVRIIVGLLHHHHRISPGHPFPLNYKAMLTTIMRSIWREFMILPYMMGGHCYHYLEKIFTRRKLTPITCGHWLHLVADSSVRSVWERSILE